MRIACAIIAVIWIAFSWTGCNERPNVDFQKVTSAAPETQPTGLVADSAMVVSAHPEATRIGLEVLKRGGNAADATVAVHFALAVCFPYAGNIGGGGFLIYRDHAGQSSALDFREAAPALAHRDMYLDEKGEVIKGLSEAGALSSGVPGSVDGMWQLHQKYGQMPWVELLEYAVQLADTGFNATEHDALWYNKTQSDFILHNSEGGYLLNAKGWKMGDRIIQKDLANTLRRIQQNGRDGFYLGETAQLLVKQMEHSGGIITTEDLSNYKALWREPLLGRYKNLEILTMPPPSGGGLILMQSLKMLESFDLKAWGIEDSRTIHVMVESLRRAFPDRSEFIGDPAFTVIPKNLLDSNYLAGRMKDFNPGKATPSKSIHHGTFHESEETTHYSIVDPFGNAVSVTTTINGPFGSKVWVQGAGFLLNNEMDDFSSKPGVPNMYGLIGNEANAIAPGKRMASSMTPTIVVENGHVKMVIGTPGGSTIPVSLLQCFLNVFEHGMSMQASVAHKRFHHQWLPDEIAVEDSVFQTTTWIALRDMGHYICLRDPIGRVNGILVHPDGQLEAGADPRRDDCAAGF